MRLTIDQGNAGTVRTSFANTLEISLQEIGTTNLEAFLDHFGSELIHAVFRGIAKDVINGATTVLGSPVLANVLDAPITELAMRNNVNAGKHLVDASTLVGNIS